MIRINDQSLNTSGLIAAWAARSRYCTPSFSYSILFPKRARREIVEVAASQTSASHLNTVRSANCQLPEHALAFRSAGQVEVQTPIAAIGPERYASGLRCDQRIGFGDEARLPAADAEAGALHHLNPCTSSPGSGHGSRGCRGRFARGGRSSRRFPVRSASARRPARRRACGRYAGWCGATPVPSRNP